VKQFNKSEIENIIGYKFKDENLLLQSFTHSSYAKENGAESYERIEYLGDSALGFVVAMELYRRFPQCDEGKLTRLRASLVSAKSLSAIIDKTSLIEYMRLGKGEIQSSALQSENVKCDLFEAIAGAILLDSSYNIEECRNFILKLLSDSIHDIEEGHVQPDYKSKLLEECAKTNKMVEFRIQTNSSPFKVQLYIDNKFIAEAEGQTKKAAEKAAAKLYFSQK